METVLVNVGDIKHSSGL